jgi:hypothetical protein
MGISQIKTTEAMKHKQKKEELEYDRYQMVSALAAIKRHRLLVNHNHQLNNKIRFIISPDVSPEILKDMKSEQEDTEQRMREAE